MGVASHAQQAHPPAAAASAELSEQLAQVRERRLFLRYQRDGDVRARDEIVSRFMGLAYSVAKRYSRGGRVDDDLTQVASLGLIQAVDRFETERGHRFSSFAVPSMIGELKRHLRQHAWGVHVPRSLQEEALAVARAADQLSSELGRTPTPRELAQRLDLSIEQVVEAREAALAREPERLDAPLAPDRQESAISELGGEDGEIVLAEQREDVRRALAELTDAERALLRMRFFEDLTQAEIARRLGVSQMHVSRLLRKAIERAHVVISAGPKKS
jgi:RNA polymerase sigma-B factor